jgi:serine protease inhibitor
MKTRLGTIVIGLACVAFVLLGVYLGANSTTTPRLLAAAPEGTGGTTAMSNPNPDLPSVGIFADANTKFGIAILKILSASDTPGNVFISPLSISTCLAMTSNGASGSTLEAMQKALNLDGVPEEDINEGASSLAAYLSGKEEDRQMIMANSVWVNKRAPAEQAFIDICKMAYGAQTSNLDFASPSSADTINKWVSDHTAEKIKDIVQRLNATDIMVLVNTAYFKAKWAHEFSASSTKPLPFHLPGGSSKDTPMMRRSADFQYMENDDFQAVELPFMGRPATSMYVFLPSKSLGVTGLVKMLTPENWGKWLQGLEERKGELKLPRFKLGYSASLNKPLSDLGMSVAFSPDEADFSRMTKVKPAWISQVMHKTYLDVNEKGVEAAAATAVMMAGSAMPQPDPRPPFVMIVDRPFMCAIADSTTKTILFIGVIADPTK